MDGGNKMQWDVIRLKLDVCSIRVYISDLEFDWVQSSSSHIYNTRLLVWINLIGTKICASAESIELKFLVVL